MRGIAAARSEAARAPSRRGSVVWDRQLHKPYVGRSRARANAAASRSRSSAVGRPVLRAAFGGPTTTNISVDDDGDADDRRERARLIAIHGRRPCTRSSRGPARGRQDGPARDGARRRRRPSTSSCQRSCRRSRSSGGRRPIAALGGSDDDDEDPDDDGSVRSSQPS